VSVDKQGPAAPPALNSPPLEGQPPNTVVMHPARLFGNTAPQSAWATGPTVDQPSYDL
jgi:hypothetical protein